MSKKANPAAIGMFVVAAVAIVVAGLITLGSGRFFQESSPYVLHFEGDLSGLDVGAPVTIQGVRVGQVKEVSIVYDHATDDITTPVVIEILDDSFVQRNEALNPEGESKMGLHVERGLRARLTSQSLVTGKLKVSLDYHPETEIVYRDTHSALPEIPTIPGVFDSLARRINDLPLEEIILDLRSATQGISTLVNSGELESALVEMRRAFSEVGDLADSEAILKAVDSFDATMESIREVARADEFKRIATSIDQTLKETQIVLKDFRKGSDPLRREVVTAIEELIDLARQVQTLLEYLERHPEALIRGKGNK